MPFTKKMTLIVVRIHQGKLFPSSGLLFVKGCWGAEEACTETVLCTETVAISQEVAFSVLKRNKIKSKKKIVLECHHSPTEEATPTMLGSITLSLPPLIEARAGLKTWYNVESAEKGSSPESPSLLLSIFYEQQDAVDDDESATESTDVPVVERPADDLLILKPTLVSSCDGEFYRIGGPAGDAEFYTVAVTVSFAENLAALLPVDSAWPPEGVPFYLHFNVLGQPIRLRPFCSLRDPVRVHERATVKIQSTALNLLRFFKRSMPSLTVGLTCDEMPVGEASVPVGERIDGGRSWQRLHLEPIEIAGVYPVKPLLLETDHRELAPLAKPRIGVQVLISLVSASASEAATAAKAPTTTKSGTEDSHPKERRTDLMYAAALELELWKEDQKLLAREKLQHEARSHLELLNAEYRRQAAAREAELRQRLDRCRDLETQLEKAIEAVRGQEQQVQRERTELGRERGRAAAERRDAAVEVERVTQRLQAEYEFKLQAERRRHAFIVNQLRHGKPKTPASPSAEEMAESQLEVTRLKAAQDELQAEQRRAADEASRLRLSERQWQRIAAEQHLVLNRLCRFLLSDQTGSPKRPLGSSKPTTTATRHERNVVLQELRSAIAKVEPMLKEIME